MLSAGDDFRRGGGGVCSAAQVLCERFGFVLLAGLAWAATVYGVLKAQHFPFHLHRDVVCAVLGLPVLLFALIVLVIDPRLLRCVPQRQKDKRR